MIRVIIEGFEIVVKDEYDKVGWGQQIAEWYNVGGSKEEIQNILSKRNRSLLLNELLKMKTEIIPVIHKLTDEQVKANIEACLSVGISKIFLIDHRGGTHEQLIADAIRLKSEYNIWVGINLLGLTTEDALSQDIAVDGLWCDASITPVLAKSVRKFKGQFFGGLAFKYQPQPTDLESACKDSTLATDVATTSGPGTGKAATVTKIELLRSHLGNHPLAIASGVSIDNIESYKGLVNYLLVASSITDHNELIDVNKLSALNSKL